MPYYSNPLEGHPTRAVNLQKYLVLHAQHEDLLSQVASLTSHKRRPNQLLNYHGPPSSTTAGSEAHSFIPPERKLYHVNQQIKTTLTELLNCESVKRDRLYRAWVQTRLMEAERELKQGRRQGFTTIGFGERYVGDVKGISVEQVRV